MANRWRIGPISAATLLLLAATLGGNARGAEPADEPPRHVETLDENPLRLTIQMRVSPAAEPMPALRFRFLVPPVDQVHANAATFYYKAMADEGADWIGQLNADDTFQSWLNTPSEKLPLDEVRKRIAPLQGNEFQAALQDAAQADYCDWGVPIRRFGVDTMLGEAQKLRYLARAMSVAMRVEIAQRRYLQAIDQLRSNYALSRHLGQSPSIVHSLIGMAIEGLAEETTRDLIAAPGSPNLYWPLTELAGRPIEIRGGLSYETRFWEFTSHEIDDLTRRALTPAETVAIAKRVYLVNDFNAPGSRQTQKWGTDEELELMASALSIEPAARAFLADHGYSGEQIEAMPILQRGLLYRWLEFTKIRDDYFKWDLLPDEEALERLTRLDAEDVHAGRGDAGRPFIEALPATLSCMAAALRKQREINLLRTVEALRMYAASNGNWPKTLAEVKAVPVPIDPVMQKPFEYSVAGRVATLAAQGKTHSGNLSQAFFPIRYELTLRDDSSEK